MELETRDDLRFYPPWSISRLDVLGGEAPPSETIHRNERPCIRIWLLPTEANHTVHWGAVTWPETMQSLSISRRSAVASGLGSLLNGLRLPPWLKSLELSEKESGPNGLPPIGFNPCRGLDYFSATRIEVESVYLICRESENMNKLVLCGMVLDFGDWIPRSLRKLTMGNCPVQSIGFQLRDLTDAAMVGCGLTQLPSDINVMFPALVRLDVSHNRIESLRGVVFPPELFELNMRGNGGIDMEGALLPPGLLNLTLSYCYPISGLPVLRLPTGLGCFRISGNGLTTTDNIRLPPGISVIDVTANPLTNTDYLTRYSLIYDAYVFGIQQPAASVCSAMRRYYGNQLVVRVLVSVRRIPRIAARSAVRKLPGDLLRVALGFLAETPQLQ